MKITLEQLKKLAHGCVRIEEEEGWARLHRFPKDRVDYYYDTLKQEHTLDTAGMRLECVTDAERLSLDYDFSIGTRPYYCFDLYVDGKPCADWGRPNNVPEKEQCHLAFSLPAGKKRLTLWLPQIGIVRLKNIVLENATLLEFTTYSKTLLAIGDSITHGSAAYHPANTWPARLARAWGVELINQGIGGDAHRMDSLGNGIGFCPDFVTVLYGCNDWFARTKERQTQVCQAFYSQLSQLYAKAKIAVLTPIWNQEPQEGKPLGTLDDVRQVTENEVKKYPNMTLIRGQELIPEDPALFADTFHPNDRGFEVMAQCLKPRLEKIFGL